MALTHYFLIMALSVASCLTQEMKQYSSMDNNDTNDFDDIQYYEEDSNNDNSTLEQKSTTNEPQGPPAMETLCHVGHMKCDRKMSSNSNKITQVCAYQKTHGLINFQSPCDIALQNCLYKAYQAKVGREANDLFFYNDKGKPCQYYLKMGEKLEDAVKLYHIDKFNFGKFSEEFEKVDKNNKYGFIDLVYA